MLIPNLDEVTKKALNELTLKEVSRAVSYAFEHELLWYGIDGVVHTHLMRKALDISKGIISFDKFVADYSLTILEGDRLPLINVDPNIVVPLKKIENDGIYVPPQAYFNRSRNTFVDRKITLFDKDYNRSSGSYKHARELMDRKWKLRDLEDLDLVEKGIQFGKRIWERSVETFDMYKNGKLDSNIPIPPQNVTDLGEKLIEYYSKIVLE